MCSNFNKYFLKTSVHLFIITLILLHFKTYSLEKNTIRLAYYENAPPLSYIEENKGKGGFYDIANLILGKMMGIKLVQDAFPWERAQEFVRQGAYNAHITIQTEERNKFLLFQKGYTLKLHIYLVFSKNNPKVNEIKK